MRHHGLGSHGTYPIARALIVCTLGPIFFPLSRVMIRHVYKLKCINLILDYTFKRWSTSAKSVYKGRDEMKLGQAKISVREGRKGDLPAPPKLLIGPPCCSL